MRTLVIADSATADSVLHQAIADRAAKTDEVFVIGPGCDRGRVAACLSGLSECGVFAWGRVGPADPMVALADALRDFPADEIVIAGDAASERRRLGAGLARRASMEFGLPVALLRLETARPRSALGGGRRPADPVAAPAFVR